MKHKVYYKIVLAFTLQDIVLLTACIPVCHTVYPIKVKNCTSDTLIIGGTCYYSIDSIPFLYARTNVGSMVIKGCRTREIKGSFITPDSIGITSKAIVLDKDFGYKGYFFIIKLEDTRKHTWNFICKNKLYDVLVVTKQMADENGDLIAYKPQPAKQQVVARQVMGDGISSINPLSEKVYANGT